MSREVEGKMKEQNIRKGNQQAYDDASCDCDGDCDRRTMLNVACGTKSIAACVSFHM